MWGHTKLKVNRWGFYSICKCPVCTYTASSSSTSMHKASAAWICHVPRIHPSSHLVTTLTRVTELFCLPSIFMSSIPTYQIKLSVDNGLDGGEKQTQKILNIRKSKSIHSEVWKKSEKNIKGHKELFLLHFHYSAFLCKKLTIRVTHNSKSV